jgi:arylsulfatase A-like enzyme
LPLIPHRRSPRFLLAFVSLLCGLPAMRAGAAQRITGRSTAGTDGAAVAPPNVVVIITDDQRWDTMYGKQGLGGANVMPQVVSQLCNSGVLFKNAYATTSICAPSRSSLLSGQYAHNHGVHGNLAPSGAVAFNDTATLATALDAAGYRTGLYGKYLNDYNRLWPNGGTPYEPPGWDEWHAFKIPAYFNYTLVENGVEVPFGSAVADYSTDVIKSKAVTFIKTSVNNQQPFFLYFAPYAPHKPYTPAPRHAGMFATLPNFRPPNYNEADTTDKPAWLVNRPQLTPAELAQIDTDRRGYLETLQSVDDAVSSIMMNLNTLGVAQNTMVIFVGDHSYFWGEHRIDGKGTAYEENVRIPLVIRYPPLAPAARIESRLVLNVDLTATILQITGAAAPHPPDGVSLVPILANQQVPWRTNFLTEAWDAEAVPTQPYWSGIHEGNWAYSELRSGEVELYDIVTDPFQLSNQASNPANEALINSFAAKLRAYRPTWPADVGCVDVDGDGYAPPGGTQCHSRLDDCDDANAVAWAVPGEAGVYLDLPPPGKTTISWSAPATAGCPSTLLKYDTIRSSLAGNFTSAVCIESNDGPGTTSSDATVPAVNKAFFYLVRARNACPGGTGTLGKTSAGTTRTGKSCP